MAAPDRRRRLAALAGLSALLVAALAVATNLATALVPAGWGWAADPRVAWGAVALLLAAVVVVAVVAARAGADPGDGPPDPRFTAVTADALPEYVGLLDVLGVPAADTRAAVLERWARPPDGSVEVVLGTTYGGRTVALDLRRDGPSGYVCGASGSGTTEALLSVAVSLAWRYPPEQVRLHLLDFKNSAVWGAVARLPHVATVATLADGLASPGSLRAHLDDLLERRRTAPGAGFELVMIDEFPTAERHLLEHVERVAALGRTLGCGVLVGFPTAAAAARAGPVLRYGLALGARAVREHPMTADLPADRFAGLFAAGHQPGRGVLVHAGHTIVPVQVASTARWRRDGPVPWLDRRDLDAVVDAVAAAGRADRGRAPS